MPRCLAWSPDPVHLTATARIMLHLLQGAHSRRPADPRTKPFYHNGDQSLLRPVGENRCEIDDIIPDFFGSIRHRRSAKRVGQSWWLSSASWPPRHLPQGTRCPALRTSRIPWRLPKVVRTPARCANCWAMRISTSGTFSQCPRWTENPWPCRTSAHRAWRWGSGSEAETRLWAGG